MDILAMDKKNSYTGSLKNGVQSERYLLVFFSGFKILSGRDKCVHDTLASLKYFNFWMDHTQAFVLL